MTYSVYVDDNWHYMNESERYLLGKFETLEEAIAAAKRLVDNFLFGQFESGMSPGMLSLAYASFGKDPFVVGVAGDAVPFSARTYARQRCDEICSMGAPE